MKAIERENDDLKDALPKSSQRIDNVNDLWIQIPGSVSEFARSLRAISTIADQ